MANPSIPKKEGKELQDCIDQILNTGYAAQYRITPQEISNLQQTIRTSGNVYNPITESQIETECRLIWEEIRLLDGLTDEQKLEEYRQRRMNRYFQLMREDMIRYEIFKSDYMSLCNNPYLTRDQRAFLKDAVEFLCEVIRRIEHVKRVFEEWQAE
jgi:hypothetical protein